MVVGAVAYPELACSYIKLTVLCLHESNIILSVHYYRPFIIWGCKVNVLCDTLSTHGAIQDPGSFVGQMHHIAAIKSRRHSSWLLCLWWIWDVLMSRSSICYLERLLGVAVAYDELACI